MSYNSSFLLLLATVVILLVAGFPLYVRYKHLLKIKAVVITGYYFGIVGALLVVHAILYWPGAQSQVFGELAALAGSSLGWLIGMWLSPIGSTESTKFSKYWTAIGVGSGFTLKWAIDHVAGNADWIARHAFISSLFCVALLVTTAAVYNTRAYSDALTIAPRQPLNAATVVDEDGVQVRAGSQTAFYAAVTGPNDPLSKWSVFPPELGTVSGEGVFTAAAVAGSGRITAFNIEDPSLSGCMAVRVVL